MSRVGRGWSRVLSRVTLHETIDSIHLSRCHEYRTPQATPPLAGRAPHDNYGKDDFHVVPYIADLDREVWTKTE
jgi:hypothetical protein